MQNKKVKKSLNRDRAFPQIYDAINEQMSSFTWLSRNLFIIVFVDVTNAQRVEKKKLMMNDEIERSRDQELGLIADIVVQLFWIMIWKRVYTVWRHEWHPLITPMRVRHDFHLFLNFFQRSNPMDRLFITPRVTAEKKKKNQAMTTRFSSRRWKRSFVFHAAPVTRFSSSAC